jgi:hypothetical protein
LARAPFDVNHTELVPKAGACPVCPKRTGSSPMLFAEIRSTDTCTDTNCFKAKCNALIQIRLKEHPGALRITLGETSYEERQVVAREHIIQQDRGYGWYGTEGPRWKQSSAGACEFTKDAVVVMGETPSLGQHKLVCIEPKCPVHANRRGGERAPKQLGVLSEERRKQIEDLWQRRMRHACRVALHKAVREKQAKMATVPVEALRFAVRKAYHAIRPLQDGALYLENVWGAVKKSRSRSIATYGHGLDALIENGDHYTLLRLLIDFPLGDDVAGKFSAGKEIELVADAYGLDKKAITTPVLKEWNEKKHVSYAKREARLAKEREKLAKLEARRKTGTRTAAGTKAAGKKEKSA